MIPEKTIERLSLYRRILINNKAKGKEYMFSHELASQLHFTPVQVRRDIMLIGYSGTQRKGYDVNELINKISTILDPEESENTIVIGMGHLGKAITNYFNTQQAKIDIVASFDNDSTKVDRIISGIMSYHIDNLEMIIGEKCVSIAILTLPPAQAQEVCDRLIYAGVKGVLNFTGVPLNVSPDVYLENYDMVTSLEKVAYFVKSSH